MLNIVNNPIKKEKTNSFWKNELFGVKYRKRKHLKLRAILLRLHTSQEQIKNENKRRK